MKSLPKGIIVFAIVAILDAVASMIFMIYFVTVPDIVPIINDDPLSAYFVNIAEYKILGTAFSDNLIVGFTFIVVVDTLMVIGLLSHKFWSRRMVIGCNILGVIFNVSIINFPGLIFNVILLGYMLKTSTKEYYLKTI